MDSMKERSLSLKGGQACFPPGRLLPLPVRAALIHHVLRLAKLSCAYNSWRFPVALAEMLLVRSMSGMVHGRMISLNALLSESSILSVSIFPIFPAQSLATQ